MNYSSIFIFILCNYLTSDLFSQQRNQSYDQKTENPLNLNSNNTSKANKRSLFLSSNNYFGYEFVYPNLKKGWKNNGPWIALNAQGAFDQTLFFRLGIGLGNAYNVKNNESVQQFGNYKFIGIFYKYPFRILKNLVVIEPEVGIDFITAQFRDEREKDPNSVGFGITPGIGVKVGPVKVVGKYTTSFAYSIGDNSNAWAGGMNYPSLGLFFETGWGLMSPKRIVSKGILTTQEETRNLIGSYIETVGTAEPYLVNVYRVVTTYHDHEINSVVHDVRPFWFISAKVNSSLMINKENSNTLLYGGEFGFRAGMLAGELFYSTGKYGFVSPVGKQELINQYGVAPDLSGTINSNVYGGKIGVDVVAVLTKIFVHSHENRKIYNATRFTRFILAYGAGSTQFTGKPEFFNENGEQQMNNYYTVRPDLKPSSNAIPGQVSNANFTVFNAKLEMGVVALGYESYKYKNSGFANNKTLTLSYMIPPGRLIRKVQNLVIARKIVKGIKNKNEKSLKK